MTIRKGRLPRSEVARLNSPGELLLEAQLRQAGIPYVREYQFHPERKWRADFWINEWPWCAECGSRGLLVEVDGATWQLGRHNRPSSIPAEYEKRAAAAILGYRTIACTTEQVNDGTCLRWIEAALGRRAPKADEELDDPGKPERHWL